MFNDLVDFDFLPLVPDDHLVINGKEDFIKKILLMNKNDEEENIIFCFFVFSFSLIIV